MTTITGEYAPSTSAWVRKQVETIEETGTTTSVHIQHRPVVLLTMRGKASGKVRKVPLMRVEHEGVYTAVASKGGAPDHPQWYFNLLAHPDLDLQDAVQSLRDAGHDRLADSVDLVMRGRNVIGDHWTFELVESYDADYISPFRAVEQAARETLGLPTHLFEAEMKAREQDAP